jgi:hypothetical protein
MDIAPNAHSASNPDLNFRDFIAILLITVTSRCYDREIRGLRRIG